MSDRVVHFEIPFDDGPRARSFYSQAFGWMVEEVPELSYTMVSTGPMTDQGVPADHGFINGGMFERGDHPARGPVVTIGVESIDATLKKIAGLGGATVVDKQKVGDMGFSAYATDSEGNVIGLWEEARQG